MATEKEVIILDFQVEQGSAISELEKTKKSIIQLKQEQQDLNKAYKAGNVTIEEYASESVRLEAILKKQQSTYTNVQKSVTGVKTKMDDLIASNNKLADSVKESTSNIRVAGVSVGELTSKIASFATPTGAAIGLVTALGAAYARSANGAKDLEFAQNQLNSAIGLISNRFADLIGASDQDGDGLLTRFVNAYLTIGYYSPVGQALRLFGVDLKDVRDESKNAALALERLQDLQREELRIRSQAADRFGDNQESLSRIQDSQTDFNQKLLEAEAIGFNIRRNETALLNIKQKQIDELEKQKADAKDIEKIELEIERIALEKAAISKDADRKFQANERLKSNLQDQEKKRVEGIAAEEQKKADASNKIVQNQRELAQLEKERAEDKAREDRASGRKGPDTSELTTVKIAKIEAKAVVQSEEDKQQAYRDSFNLKRQLDEESLFLTEMMLGQASQLFEENTAAGKILSSATATINTYRGATLALAELPPPFSFIQAALTIATGLASVARINGVAAAGGADFITNRPTMLLVGDNPGGRERVTVEPLSGRGQTRIFNNGLAMAGGGSLTVDGGAAKNAATQSINQTLMYANAIKNMPMPVVSWVEGRDVGRRVEFKERVSRL